MKKSLIRTGLETLYFSGAHRMMQRYFGGVGAILMLHHVRPPQRGGFQPNRLLEVKPAFLERIIRLLQRSRIDIVSLDEVYRRLTERDFARRFAHLDGDLWDRPKLQQVYLQAIRKCVACPLRQRERPSRRRRWRWLLCRSL